MFIFSKVSHLHTGDEDKIVNMSIMCEFDMDLELSAVGNSAK